MQDLDIKISYVGRGDKILNDFLLPVIKKSISYDRITSFYTIDSLIAISQGIESLYEKHGKMRLIIGIHSFPSEVVNVILRRTELKERIREINEKISNEILSITDSLRDEKLATIAWMIDAGLLEVRAVATHGDGIFHPKTLILSDEDGNRIAAVGSPNETAFGLGSNYEQIMVVKSWMDEVAVQIQEDFFESLWNNEEDGLTVVAITEEVADAIKRGLGVRYNRIRNHTKSTKDIIGISSKMPANFFVSGDIPALYTHQERAVIDALSRWPVRILFSDEVGLGKTFEVAATLAFLIKYCGIKKVAILTPKSVLKQWQDELYTNFKINAWLYSSGEKLYRNATNEEKYIGSENPLGILSPDIILMSAQYARGGKYKRNVFEADDIVLPDLIVLDEAHSARVSQGLGGAFKKTQIYKMLENISRKVPHLILATATPMQKDPEEYHALLKLLGLPNTWQKTKRYMTSLNLLMQNEAPDNTDAKTIAKLLRDIVIYMNPNLGSLSDNERQSLKKLINLFDKDEDSGYEYLQDYWHILRPVLIKIHPAHLLTIRNTRKSLSRLGYKFPKRNLIEESINDSDEVQMFYHKVEAYLYGDCFAVEKAIMSNKAKTVGFSKSSYQQRLASSLYSCQESLRRRWEKLTSIRKTIDLNLPYSELIKILSKDNDIEDNDDEDLLNDDNEEMVIKKSIDIHEVRHAVNIEMATVTSLLGEAGGLLDGNKDLKVVQSIQLTSKCLANGDKVLLFSRYTDTITALITEFKKNELDIYRYGIYTGKESTIVSNGREIPCDKNDLKNELSSGKLRLVFCSDAASEGLNLQAARVLINVDVPWTPARLEQRIGRIARLGQVADEVDIYNVWYPHSIEARMYRMIQSRLQKTNIAVGEFPDVMATSIRNAIINNEEENDHAIEELKKVRSSKEMMALETLWLPDVNKTISNNMRDSLMTICSNTFPIVEDSEAGTKTFRMPDNTIVKLTSKEGCPESISLTSLPWLYQDFESDSLNAVYGALDFPAYFTYNNDSSEVPIKHESVLKVINNELVTDKDILHRYPIMLPDNNRLNLRYSIDVEANNKPIFWKGNNED